MIIEKKEIGEKKTGRILVVDDEPDIASLLKMALEYDGSFRSIQTFDDPLVALSNFKAGLYDLVILDITMPNADGLHLYQEMKTIDNKVKFCFLTGCDTYSDKLDNSMLIRKPISIKALLREIARRFDIT